MKKCILPLLFVLLMLAACGGATQPGSGSLAQSSTAPEMPGESSAPSVATTAPVTAAYAQDAFPAGTGDFDEYVDDTSEYRVRVAFTAGETVTAFKYLQLRFVEAKEDGAMVFAVEKELYTADTLTPQRPLVVGMAFAGEIPNRGISYTDAAGAAHTFAVTTSGKDGSLVLFEIEV